MSLEIDRILAASPVTQRGQPTQLSCDPKGERIAYASGKSIFIRNIDDHSISKQYTGHTAATTVARFSPSGFYVASGDVSGQVRVWDAVEAVNTKGEYAIISGRINDVAWDGDSQRLIAVGDGRERFGHCITADSGNSIGEVSGHSKAVNGVAIRPVRPLRAATVSDDGAMCFLHGAPFKFASKATGLHKGFIFAVAYSPDGETIVTVGADRSIQLYNGTTGEPTRQVGEGQHTGSIFAVSWAADSKRFVTASADQTIRTWEAESGKLLYTWRLGSEGIAEVAHHQVGVVWVRGRSDGLIISLNLDGDLNYLVEGKSEPIKVVYGHNKSVTAMQLAEGGKGSSLVTGSFDGRVCTWDVSTGHGSIAVGQTHTNRVVQFAAGSGKIYSVGWDDTLRIMDQSASIFDESAVPLDTQPRGVAVTVKSILIAKTDGWAAYDIKDGKEKSKTLTAETPAAIATNGSVVAVGTERNSVHIFEDGSSKPVKTLEGPTSPISALSFSRNGELLAVGTAAGKIVVYATSSWDVVTDRWSAHTARVLCIAWNNEGTHAASGALDTTVHVWSLAKPGSRVKAVNAHKDGVYGVAWVGGSKIASTGGDAAVKIWHVQGLP